MIKFSCHRLVLILVLFIPIMSHAAATAWQVVPNKSSLTFTATQNNSPVSGEFKTFTGDIHFDPAALKDSSIVIIVDMNSVKTSYGEVADSLRTPDWFNIKVFPRGVFKANAFVKTGDKTYQAKGTLTLRNKTIPVILDFELEKYSQTDAVAKGSVMLTRTMFGVGQGEWAKTDEVKNEVQVKFVLTAIKK
ncbi:MAG: YceI family protein [Gammaproteobacteria bacterium]